jgi:predicted ferric reductase
MAPITKLMRKIKQFLWISKCQATWELIKQKYVDTYFDISWDVEFHVHKYVSLLAIGAMLAHNLTGKHDQLVVYACRLLNNVEKNYSTIECETLTMTFTLHKFKHYLFGNKFVFYVDHMA